MKLTPIEETFTSLIQQYLSLLLHSNATFLAERFIAHSPSPHSAYLLAICHYRSNSPKRAKSVLQPYAAKCSLIIEREQDEEAAESLEESMSDCILYLLAKCCVDLKLYNEAEEYLLTRAKGDYAHYKKQVKKNIQKFNINCESLEDWLEALLSMDLEENSGTDEHKVQNDELDLAATCPIPNGAAGLHLLGIICKHTSRHDKAKRFFQMSLKLDPMLWISYNELCEIGVAHMNNDAVTNLKNAKDEENGQAKSKDGVDPASIFGVIPEALLKISKAQGGYGYDGQEAKDEYIHGPTSGMTSENEEMLKRATNNHNAAGIGASPAFSLSHSPMLGLEQDLSHIQAMGDDMENNDHGKNGHRARLPTANRLSFGSAMDTTPANINAYAGGKGTPDADRSELQGTSLFHANISKIDGDPNNITGRRSSVGMPQMALFGTPNMTPQLQKDRAAVLTRARRVARRSYYEPSPETTPPNRIKTTVVPHSSLKLTRKKTRRSIIGNEFDYDHYTYGFGDKNQSHDLSMSATDRTQNKSLFGVQNKSLFDTSMDMTGVDDSPALEAKKTSMVASKLGTTKKLSKVREVDEDKSNEEGSSSNLVSSMNQENEALKSILELFCTFGAAQRMLCSFRCKEALQIYYTLPYPQFQTGWVLHQVGRAHFYAMDYINAQRSLETMQEVEPHRMKGLETLSTIFYLLKKDVELSNLAQRCVEFDQMSPETWCTVGNCFSLQNEHKTALAFFRRSIQLDPNFTYAHTLSGHEYVANEDFDHAMAAFRNAIKVDERHFNAWNALGEIYFRQEKHDMAEYHFRKALSINPQGPVIRCNLARAQQANGKHELALETLASVDKRVPQAQFQRANILITLDRPHEALKELEKVRDAEPGESSVYFAMGRVLKRLGKPEKAMTCFLKALDLDPKENTLIKSAIDKLEELDDGMDDVSAF